MVKETVAKLNRPRKKRKRGDETDVNAEIRKLMKLSADPNNPENVEDSEFILEDYVSDDYDDGNELEFIDKIYYASRTHSQEKVRGYIKNAIFFFIRIFNLEVSFHNLLKK